MHPYRTATASERDARAEQRQRRAFAANPLRPPTDGDERRQPFDWTFSCDGVSWSLHFEPNPRGMRQWRVFRDGAPWMCAGLERVWRAMQKEMRPALGRRHWR